MGGRRRNGQVPPRLGRAAARFAAWRRNPRRGRRFPDGLWALAVEMAESYGLCLTASVLKLNYRRLKQEVEARSSPTSAAAKLSPTFFELPAPALTRVGECTIELESGEGSKMRMHLKGIDAPDLISLSSSFWSSQR